MILQLLASILILLGASLVLLAVVGVLRLPDVFTRMQAATKAATLGLGCLLAGGALELGGFAALIRAISIAAFIMLTSPVSTHVIARAAYLTRTPLWKGTIVDEWREDAGGMHPEHPE